MTDPETARELAELQALIPDQGPRETIWFVGAPLEVTRTQLAWLEHLTERQPRVAPVRDNGVAT